MKIAFISDAFEDTKEKLMDGYFKPGVSFIQKINITGAYEHYLLKEELEKKQFAIDYSAEYNLFLLKFGNLNLYDGLIIHVGIQNQNTIRDIEEGFPNMKKVLITGVSKPSEQYDRLFKEDFDACDSESYDRLASYKEGNILVCDANKLEDIINHLSGK